MKTKPVVLRLCLFSWGRVKEGNLEYT